MSPRLRSALRIQESGLVLVILALGVFLTCFSGRVAMPVFETGPDGTPQRVFTTGAAGDRVPLSIEKNKFLNAQNLAQLAKDTSFIAIMAVGMSIVIISGGIDLSVGAIYALASVLAAIVFRAYGPDGPQSGASAWASVPLGLLTCLAVATCCG